MITENYQTINLRREFRTPVDRLYKAWTEPATFCAWWKDLSVAEMDVRVGGRYLLKWKQDAEDYARGEFKELSPSEKIVMTWDTSDRCGGKTASLVQNSRITLNFKAVSANVSTLELIHEFLPKDRIDDHHMGWTWAMLDLDRHFNAATRRIDPALEARVTRTLPFSIDRVYAAWTTPKAMNLWFNRDGHTAGSATADVRVGGAYTMDFQLKTGALMRLYGEYKEVVPGRKLVFTWINDNHSERVSEHVQYESLVSVDFKDLGDSRTEISIVHSHLTSEEDMKEYSEGWIGCVRSQEEELNKQEKN